MPATSSAPRLIKPEATLLISASKSLIDAASNWAARPASLLTHPRPTVKHPVRRLADRRRPAIVQLEIPSTLIRGGIQGRLRVFRPDKRLKQKPDERALRPRIITTDMWQ
ncbi:hypothetical protein FCV18_00215 (plasmid) [Mycobacterium avium subsp. hominissuis]|uniref:hypothetical protein n=1 Tax=Mycobacterium avium TaxID=1764 RepID=UPI0010CD5EBF|nr:hypothetical protein [Mycobacterium avium]QCR79753.1 hypothetical protein FCV18_00215 [Mycobacterium avium subsp. hominissuis]